MEHELKKDFRQIAKGIEKGIFPREPGDVQVLFDLFSTALTLMDTLNNFQDTMYQKKELTTPNHVLLRGEWKENGPVNFKKYTPSH